MNKLIVTLSFLFIGLNSICQIKYFKADKDTITPFTSTTLRWEVIGADSIFISGIGNVKSVGEKAIKLDFDKEFTILRQSDSSVSFRSLKIIVKGRRGGSDFPEKDLFKYQNTLEIETSKLSIDQLIDKLCQTFENYGFKANTNNNISTEGDIEIVTNYSANQNLISDNSGQKRKVAFIIDIKRFEIINDKLDKGFISFKTPQILNIVIKPLIQYNLVGEPNKLNILKYPENQNAYVQVAVSLKNKINDLAKISLKNGKL